MTGGLIDDEEGGFRAARDCANQIGEKAREKTRVYEGFIDPSVYIGLTVHATAYVRGPYRVSPRVDR